MEDMDLYMECLDAIATTNHIEDADPENCIKLPPVPITDQKDDTNLADDPNNATEIPES